MLIIVLLLVGYATQVYNVHRAFRGPNWKKGFVLRGFLGHMFATAIACIVVRALLNEEIISMLQPVIVLGVVFAITAIAAAPLGVVLYRGLMRPPQNHT